CVGAGGIGVDKTFYSDLDALNIPYLAIAHDSDTYDALQTARARVQTGKENIHTVIYRRTSRIDSAPNYDPNVPDYSKTPYEAAVQHWAFHKALFPALVRENKDIIWVITTNEPDKDNDSNAEWVAEFSIHTAQMAMADGYKWAAFGWSGGTPEPRHWRQPRMVEFLRLAAANRGKVAVALHEYSWTIADIWNGRNGEDYSQVGRFTKLIEVCDEQGIGHPDIFITEWGWSEHDVPTPNVAMQHIYEAGELYAQYPAVKGAAVWYLGPGYQNIAHKAAQLVQPLKGLVLMTEYEVDDIEPPPLEKHKAIVVKLPQTMTRDEWQAATGVAYDFRHTVTASHDDMMTVLRGGNDESFVKASHPERDVEALQLVVDAGYRWEPLYDDTPAFRLTAWPTQYKVVTQKFGANPANYAPFGLPGHEGVDIRAPHGTKVFAAADGRVFAVETNPDAHNYGIHCRIEHEDGYQTIYAHMMELFVSVGEMVGSGALLGLADSTGHSDGSHLHFGMKHPDGMDGWPSNIIDPTPFLKPLAPEAWEPEPPPIGQTINIRAYFEPAGDVGPMKVLSWLDGSKTQAQQLLKRDGFVIEAKGEGQWHNGKRYDDYERYQFANGEMQRHEDTSPGWPDAYDQNGERWLPEVCEIGRQYVNQPRLSHYQRDTCEFIGDAYTTDYLTVTRRHPQWEALNGIIVNDVIEIEWRKSPAGKIEEVYYYANGLGLVGWGVGQLEAALSELPQGRTPLNPKLWGCD
ncbi:MAG TPA: M23 family metallopeptidase, partial [Verrucomicrobiae bacterium]|nr:M23 family metallopeptidase [Verrucomicrobiae bacterium]